MVAVARVVGDVEGASAAGATDGPELAAALSGQTRLQLARAAQQAFLARQAAAGVQGAVVDLPSARLRLRSTPRLCHAELVGRLGQLSGSGALSLAFGLVLDAQRAGEPVAWVASGDALFFPPDVAESGVDLDALLVVRAQDAGRAGAAGDRLLRSGGFGLLILDLATDAQASRALMAGAEVVPMPLQARLCKLAQRHDAAVLVLTGERVAARRPGAGDEAGRQASSLSSLVSWRATCQRGRVGDPSARRSQFRCELHVSKDKRRGPGWRDAEVLRGVPGMR